MASLSDEKIIESFNAVRNSGHPDPLGFIARGEIKTGFDFDGEYKGAVGSFGVDRKQAINAGYDDDDLGFSDSNLAAALDVDMTNLRSVDNDIDEMYRKSNGAGKKSTDRFMKRLDKRRRSLSEKMIFDESGSLIEIRKREKDSELGLDVAKSVTFDDDLITGGKKTDRKGDDTITDKVSIGKNKDKVIYSKSIRTATTDDVIRNTRSYEFRTADKEKIDKMVQQLVGIIVDEKSIDG